MGKSKDSEGSGGGVLKARKGLLSSIGTAVDIVANRRFFSLGELREYSKFHNGNLGPEEEYLKYCLGDSLSENQGDSFRIALHTHTKQTEEYVHGSDGLSTLPEMLSAAEGAGLSAIVVSDHASRKSLASLEDLDGKPFGTGLGWHAVSEAKLLGYGGPENGKPIVLPGVEAEVQNGIHLVLVGSDYSDYSGLFKSKKYDSLVTDLEKLRGTAQERQAELAVHFEYVESMRRQKLDRVLEYFSGVPHVATIVPHPGVIYSGAGQKLGWGADAREVNNGEEALFVTFVKDNLEQYGAVPEVGRGVGIIRHRELAELERRKKKGGYLPAQVASPDAHLDGMVDIYVTEIDGISRGDFSDIRSGVSKMKEAFRRDHSLRLGGTSPEIRYGMPEKYLEPGKLDSLAQVYCKHIDETIRGRGQALIPIANAFSRHYIRLPEKEPTAPSLASSGGEQARPQTY